MTDRLTGEALRGHWAELGAAEEAPLKAFPVAESLDGRTCRIAVDQEGGRHLVVPSPGTHLDLPAGSGILRFSSEILAFGSDGGRFLDVTCTDRQSFDEFDLLIEDVVDAARASEHPARTALDVIERWRRLFARRARDGLDTTQQMGLLAELLVLEALVAIDIGVESWQGPYQNPHDFEAPNGCLEVKAVGSELTSVEIHGLRQLESHDSRELHLVLVQLSEADDGDTIDDVADRVRAEAPSQEGVLQQALSAAGWNVDGDPGDAMRFVPTSVRVALVTTDFPRLASAGQSDPGLFSKVRYSIPVAALLPFVQASSLHAVAEAVRRNA